jgi:predicted DNA-binding transcriptional regulator AlpA
MATPASPAPAANAIGGVPHAWPELLSLKQVCAYLCMSPDTFKKICTVPPLLLNVSLRLWRRSDIDAWIAGLPVRLARSADNDSDARISPIAASQIAGEERRFIALERAKHRASRKLGKN